MEFKAPRKPWNPLGKAVPTKFHWFGGHDKRHYWQDRANFQRSWPCQIVLFFYTGYDQIDRCHARVQFWFSRKYTQLVSLRVLLWLGIDIFTPITQDNLNSIRSFVRLPDTVRLINIRGCGKVYHSDPMHYNHNKTKHHKSTNKFYWTCCIFIPTKAQAHH